MREPDRPGDHLRKAVEELLLAGLALTGRKRGSGLLDQLAAAFKSEAERWDERAEHDPAAERVRDLMRAVHDVLRSDGEQPTPARPSPGPASRKRPAAEFG